MKPLALIGYRGCGKSTVGPLVAARLGWAFVDADRELEIETGRTIAEIIRSEGEDKFRDLETSMLQKLLKPETILATGGGAVLRTLNREWLCNHSTVVWLQAPAEHLWERIRADARNVRPNLTALGGLEEVRQLLNVREPLYRETAHFSIDAIHSPETTVEELLSILSESLPGGLSKLPS